LIVPLPFALRFRPSAGRLLAIAGLAAMVGTVPAAPAQTPGAIGDAGNEPPAVVTGTVTDPARNAPLAGARVFLFGTRYATMTDAEGAFRIEAPLSGSYDLAFSHPVLTAFGIPVPRRGVFLRPGETTEVHLRVPVTPRLAALRQRCPGGERSGAILSGRAIDPEEEVPLPGVRVTLSWDLDGARQMRTVTTDRNGRYLACGLPAGVQVEARARFLGEIGETQTVVTISEHGLAERDIALRPEGTGPVGTLTGALLDWSSNAPISGAIVRLPAVGREALSDARGRFRFTEVPRGEHQVEIEHLAYGTRGHPVEVRSDRDPELEIRVPHEAIAIEGVEVTVRSASVEHRRRTGTRVDLMTRSDIEERAPVSQHVGHLIQGRFPNLSAYMVRMSDPDDSLDEHQEMRLCIVSGRRSITPRADRNPCAAVIIDGIRINDPGIYLQYLLPDEIESIEFIPPARAGFRYGTGVGNRGVLEIWTRGNGPYAERPGR